MGKLKYIDALRGVAVLLVIMVHTGSRFQYSGSITSITSIGAKGVQLFFFLSAFTIFLSYNHRKDKEEQASLNFYIRRFFRIAPLYYFGVVYYVFQILSTTRQFDPLIEIPLNLTFLHGFSPLYINSLVPGGWSIAVEMTFYIIVPFLIKTITNINRAYTFLILTLVLRYFFEKILNQTLSDFPVTTRENFSYWALPNQLPCFAFGILFYHISTTITGNIKNAIKSTSIFITSLIAAILCDKFYFGNTFFNNDIVVLISIYLSALLISHFQYKIFTNRLLTLAGTLSYSMYITHFGVLFWYDKMQILRYISLSNDIVRFLLVYSIIVITTAIISKLTYHFIETPGIAYAKQLTTRNKQRITILSNSEIH